MSLKLHNVNKLSQGSSLQVIEKDREWKDKYSKLKKELEDQLSTV